MSEAKRRRIEVGHGNSQKPVGTSALSKDRLQLELDALLSGDAGHRTLAWSAQNLIAFASPVPKPGLPPNDLSAAAAISVAPVSAVAKDPTSDPTSRSEGLNPANAGQEDAPSKPDGEGSDGGQERGAGTGLEQRQEQLQAQTKHAEAQAQARAFHAFLPPPAQSITLQFMPSPTYQRPVPGGRSSSSSHPQQGTLSHRLFPSVNLLPASSAVTSPTLISFSPSGRTLIAYFPASTFAKRVAAATRAGELSAAAQAHAQAQAQAQIQAAHAGTPGSARPGTANTAGADSAQAGSGGLSGSAMGARAGGGSTAGPAIGPTPILGTTPGQTSIVAHPNPNLGPPAPTPSQVPTSLAPGAGKGRLCIWTQGSSRALNDWILRQVIFVEDEDESSGQLEEDEVQDRKQRRGRTAPPGFVFVAGVDEPVPVPIPAAPISASDIMLENGAPGMAPLPFLRGGIREIRWCDEGRKLFIHPEVAAATDQTGDAPRPLSHPELSYSRDAPRGPTFARPDVNSTFSFRPNATGSNLAQDEIEEACFLFGKTGTISVLHRKPNPPTRAGPSFPSARPFSLTSTSLFEAGVLPLGVQKPLTVDGEQNARAHSSAGGPGSRKISHLAVGGVPDEPVLLVAYRLCSQAKNRVSDPEGRDMAAIDAHGRNQGPGTSPNAAADAAAAAGLMAQATAGIRETPVNQDPLGLMSAVTGSLGAPSFGLGFGVGDSGLGLGIGLDLELGFGSGWNSGDDDCEVVNAVLEGMIGLCEVRLRSHGNMPALVVRPLDPIPLPMSQSAAETNGNVADFGSSIQNVTHLQWLEYPHKTHAAVEGPSPLQLMVVCSHRGHRPEVTGTDGPATDAMEVDAEGSQNPAEMSSSIFKYLVQRQLDPLTEAFGSLECKKADLPPAKADWAFCEAGRSRFIGQTVLAVLPPQTVLQDGCLVAVVVRKVDATGKQHGAMLEETDTTLLQKWAWLDAMSLTLIDLPDASKNLIPSHTDLRTVWVTSPNKVWIARTVGNSAHRRVQIGTLNSGPRLANLDLQTRVGVLLGRALKTGENCEDVAALLSSLKDGLDLQSALEHALLRAGLSPQNVAEGSSEERSYKLGQIAKLVELNMLTRGPNLDTERLFLELLLCLRLISLNDLGKRMPHLPFRFDAIWPLLSQLSWVLQCLNKLCRTAVYLEAETLASGPNTHPAQKLCPRFATRSPLLQLLVLPAPRAMFLYIVQSLYRFAFWLVGDEVGPIPSSLVETKDAAASAAVKAGAKYKALGARNFAYTAAVSHTVIAWRKRQVTDGDLMPSVEAFQGPGFQTTIAQQFEYAADACRAILEASAVRLDKALPALENLRQMPSNSDNGVRWWNELATVALQDRDDYYKLAASWLDEDAGVDADLVPLFIAPVDLLDDVHALDRINSSAVNGAHVGPIERQIKAGLPSSVNHPESSTLDADDPDLGTLTMDVIRKTSLRLPSLGLDQSAAATAALLNGFGGPHQAPPPTIPTVVKSCVRCGAQTGMFELPQVLSKGLAPLEDAFRERCLCGGGWWLTST
ncbi:hypothetical protein CF327_g3701 [Tilletia walkeri]|uniref:Mediator complex subunit 16 n=1 Tax=Tilletia walkeri TaxID=117179 RepID=A0A8X7T3E3_9BASI|nr:hypothetical protein CF327_g3701 [Tilletia walkeri]KAE8266969.1 hypothetical protein A4X09_0g5378 [Tilletia walkeri]